MTDACFIGSKVREERSGWQKQVNGYDESVSLRFVVVLLELKVGSIPNYSSDILLPKAKDVSSL